jgi:hypothetical protein
MDESLRYFNAAFGYDIEVSPLRISFEKVETESWNNGNMQ